MNAQVSRFTSDTMHTHLTTRLQGLHVPLFTTDADPDVLWAAYLASFPTAEASQHHNCHACRRFLQTYGSLVVVNELGVAHSALFGLDMPNSDYRNALHAVAEYVEASKITGVFYSSERVWGTPVTGDWHHLAATPRANQVWTDRVLTAHQAMAAKREDYKTVQRALSEFKAEHLETAIAMLKADALDRGGRFLAPVQWLRELKDMRRGGNQVWAAVAVAPDGFCHPRAGMVGTLLDDIAAGLPLVEVKRKFDDKMGPLKFQRPTAAPSDGTIKQAEELVAKLGLAPAFERRFARLDEVLPGAPWRPSETAAPGGGVFDRLKPQARRHTMPERKMTYKRFAEEYGNADSIEVYAPRTGSYLAYTTAVHADAPQLFKWDGPLAWYVYNGGSQASRFNLQGGLRYPVAGIHMLPDPGREGQRVVFLIAGARDTSDGVSLALFPETIRNELHGVRKVIEAYSKSGRLLPSGGEDAAGLHFFDGIKIVATVGNIDYPITLDRFE